jgi:hypothetical protein
MAFTHDHINAFVIVGGDSDFITLVEKLKQYDRKVFVVGGRAFTSQVMQKNCTEFIAYENVVPERARPQRQARGERPRGAATQSIEQAVPLVTRALKVLTDREVSPQLGLLKSTLLQLDSSFSERDYGVSTFREFADKLAQHGLVALKHQGRSTLVELPDGSTSLTTDDATPLASHEPTSPTEARSESASSNGGDSERATPLREILEQPDSGPAPAEVSLGDGVALVRRLLAEATTAPRWPMYPRQFKQFLKASQPDFDERKYGSINDLMRACQKDGLLRMERDRQGGLRVFAGGSPRASVPHGWGLERGNGGNGHSDTESVRSAEVANESGDEGGPQAKSASAPVIVEELRRIEPVVDAEVTAVIEDPPKRKRKAPVKKKAAPRKKKTPL